MSSLLKCCGTFFYTFQEILVIRCNPPSFLMSHNNLLHDLYILDRMVVFTQLRMLTPSQLLALSIRRRGHSASGPRRRSLTHLSTPYRMTPPRHWQIYFHFTMMFKKREMSIPTRCVRGVAMSMAYHCRYVGLIIAGGGGGGEEAGYPLTFPSSSFPVILCTKLYILYRWACNTWLPT